jgi:hypothetical protein
VLTAHFYGLLFRPTTTSGAAGGSCLLLLVAAGCLCLAACGRPVAGGEGRLPAGGCWCAAVAIVNLGTRQSRLGRSESRISTFGGPGGRWQGTVANPVASWGGCELGLLSISCGPVVCVELLMAAYMAGLSPRWSDTHALDALRVLLTASSPGALHTLFDEIDSNHDGAITSEELSAFVLASGLAAKLKARDVEAIIQLGDRDGSGRIDCKEWEILAAVWAEIDQLRAELGAISPAKSSEMPPLPTSRSLRHHTRATL